MLFNVLVLHPYECDVDPNKEGYDYIFYVLNSDGTSVNLIMDSNINISGNAVKGEESDLGFVKWYADDRDNSYGPITAMNHLQTATSGWTNTNELTINEFTDDKGGKHPMKEYVVNARLPYYSEISDYSESTTYLYDYMEDAGHQTNIVSGIYGYWTLSSIASDSSNAWFVFCDGFVSGNFFLINGSCGARPVINLTI